jgi:predicted CXXCH cytochrome family protein
MQAATEQTVLGNFDNARFSKDGVETTFFKKDDKFWVRTDGPDGKLADFEIRYTFGIAPLQQYLIGLPGGRYQALGIAWDARPREAGGQRWFHLYPDQTLKAGDPLHWTGIDQNWNYQCAWCHSTNLQKNYDASRREFQTTWSEISVGCEACHGPASGHVAWAKDGGAGPGPKPHAKGFALSLDERRNVSWPMGPAGQAARSVARTSSKEIEVCATCHARREQFSADPAATGRLLDAFRPSLLQQGLYHADGQQHDEVFNYGSFVQSKMHAAGVTCSDCHNPHSGRLRETGNAVCAQCHAPERFDKAAHHHHPEGTPGAQCAACHMPTTTYMGVDARHDHSMRIPRPDRSVMLGTPNACNMCHKDKPASWARDAMKVWYPSPKAGLQNFAEAFDLGDRDAPGAQAELLKIAEDEAGTAISRASALARLGNFASPEVLDLASRSAKIADPLVRAAAIPILAGADAQTRIAVLTPLLRDPARVVRMDAARALAGAGEAGLQGEDRKAFETALGEYVAGQLFNAERPEAHVNLGELYRTQGKLDAARASLRSAMELDPTFVGASISLADLERATGDESGAEAILRAALAANPRSGPVVHALGLSLVRQKRPDEAMALLERARELAPDVSRYSYVLAVALHDRGKAPEAIAILKSALGSHPYDREILMALVTYEIQSGNLAEALQHGELLDKLEPNSPQIAQMLAYLRQRVR